MKTKRGANTKNKQTKVKPGKDDNRGSDQDRIAYLANLVDTISDALISTDVEFNILEWNAAAKNMYGWEAAEVKGHLITEFIQSEYTNTTREDAVKVLLEQGSWKGEVTQKRKDGTQIPVMASVSLVKDQSGKPIGFVSINRDITERKQAEEALRESNTFNTSLLQSISFGIDIVDEHGNILYLNPALEAVVGTHALGKVCWSVYKANRKQCEHCPLKKRINIDETKTIESDGVMGNKVFEISHTGIFYRGQKAVLEVFYDITRRKQAEEVLQQSEQKFFTLFEKAAFAATLSKLPDGVIVNANHEFERIFGFTQQEAIGKTSLELGINPDAEGRARVLAALKDQGVARSLELALHTKSGELRIFSVNVELMEIGNEKYILNTSRDITEFKLKEARIAQLTRLYLTLSQINQTIVRVKDRDELYQSICNIAVEFGGFSLAWIGLLDETTGDIKPVVANGLDIKHWPFQDINIHHGAFKDGLVATAIRNSTVITSEDLQTDQRVQSSRDKIGKYGYHSSAAVPFRLRGKTIGVVSLTSNEAGFFKAEEEIRLLDEMGLDISFALDTMETETERRQAEVEVLSLSKFPSENPNPVLRVAQDGKILYANQASVHLLKTLEREVGQIVPEEWSEYIRQVSESGTNMGIEVETFGKILACVLSPIRGAGYINIYCLDITESKRGEEKLRQSEEQYRGLFEHMNEGIAYCQMIYENEEPQDWIYLSVNQEFENLTGLKNATGTRVSELIPDIHKMDPELFEIYSQVARGGEPVKFEIFVKALQQWFQVSAFCPRIGYFVAIFDVITEHKQAEEKLRVSEVGYRRLFEAAKDGILILDAETGEIRDVNPFLIELLGYSHTELLGKRLWELGLFKDIVANKESFQELQAKRYIRYENLPLQSKGGDKIFVEFISNAYEVNGRQAMQCNVRNITERKQMEEKIGRQNQRLKVLREIDIAILMANSIENIIGAALNHIRELIDCRRAGVILIDWNTNEGVVFDVRTTEKTSAPKGTRIPLMLFQAMPQAMARPLLNNQPVLINDLTELPELPPLLQTLSNEGLRSVCILPLFSQGSQIGTLNLLSEIPAFFDEERIGLGREVANQVAIAITQNRLLESLLQLNTQLEERVTERTDELTQTNIELEHANHAKDEFLANMSHELRTPLNSILGMSEILLEQRKGMLNEYQQKSLQTILSSGQHLLELINDILDLSKIEAGKLDHFPEITEVEALCRSSLVFVKEQAIRKSITVTYEEEKAVSKIYADARRLKQILINLLTNAVKFTPEGGQVTLQVHADMERDSIQFSVIDNGIGISPENLEKLFRPFVQVDSHLNRQFEGTGLGLALVQKLTDLHGGSVQVESEIGKGSRFMINLPLGRDIITQQEVIESGHKFPSIEQSERPTTSLTSALKRHVVLLAEDHPANILTFEEYLTSHGFDVLIAHDGQEALEKAETGNPDIILMDIQMPVIDGLEATRRLRANHRFDRTPIIALTALAMPGDRERCFDAGANEYMSKPISLKALLKTVDRLIHALNKE